LHRLGEAKDDLGQVGRHLCSARRWVDQYWQAQGETRIAGPSSIKSRSASHLPFRSQVGARRAANPEEPREKASARTGHRPPYRTGRTKVAPKDASSAPATIYSQRP
jgi:hypothetical protein